MPGAVAAYRNGTMKRRADRAATGRPAGRELVNHGEVTE